jgi:hypothetical protein
VPQVSKKDVEQRNKSGAIVLSPSGEKTHIVFPPKKLPPACLSSSGDTENTRGGVIESSERGSLF